jgi:hypothetical protein
MLAATLHISHWLAGHAVHLRWSADVRVISASRAIIFSQQQQAEPDQSAGRTGAALSSSATLLLGPDASSSSGAGVRSGRAATIELRLRVGGSDLGGVQPMMLCGSSCAGAYVEALKAPQRGSTSLNVRLPAWERSAHVTLSFPSAVSVAKAYHAAIVASTPEAATFALDAKSPGGSNAFQLTVTSAVELSAIRISCGDIAPPPPPLPSPPSPPPLPEMMVPEKVSGAVVVATSCDSLSVRVRLPTSRRQQPSRYVVAGSSAAALSHTPISCKAQEGGGASSGWTMCTLSGLRADTAYTFTLAAANGAGVGPPSHPRPPRSHHTTPPPRAQKPRSP